MNATEEKARQMRVQAHDSLAELYEKARAEVIRIQTLDALLGDSSLGGDALGPFVSSAPLPSPGEAQSSALPPSSKPPPKKPGKKKKPKKKRAKKRGSSGTSGQRKERGFLPKVIETVLRRYQGRQLSKTDIGRIALQDGIADEINDGSLGALLTKWFGKSGEAPPWIQKHKDGRKVTFSLKVVPQSTEPQEHNSNEGSAGL